MTLEDFLKVNYNYNSDIRDNMKSYIEQWESWYIGNVKSFHNFYIYNGEKKVKQKRYTMNMAKEISEDWADILWSEKCFIELNAEEKKKDFEKIGNEIDLYNIINQAIEKAGAVGTSAVVTSAYDLVYNQDKMTIDTSNAKTRLEIIEVDDIYPLSWNNKEITECAFSNTEYANGIKYVILSVHKKDENGNYIIKNHLFQETNKNLQEIQNNENTMNEVKTDSVIKTFSIFKPLIANNLCKNSPFGIPYYANAIDNLKMVDLCFDSIKSELINGKRITFVRSDLLNYDDGTQKMTFDPEDTQIYRLPKGATKEDLVQDSATQLRTGDLINSLNTALNILGSKVGFGENHYHFDGTNLSTATAVISSNSKMFRRKKRLEIGYEKSILDLVKAICFISTKYGQYNFNVENDKDIKVSFDDSIIEDKESESNRALREISAGVLSKVEYRENIFGETTELATKRIEEIKKQDPSLKELVGINNE